MKQAKLVPIILIVAVSIPVPVKCETTTASPAPDATASTATSPPPPILFAFTTTTTIATTSTEPPATTSTTTTGKPTSRRHRIGSSLIHSSSSSSSSSAEEQLAPFLPSSSSSKNAGFQTVCTLSKVSFMRTAIHHNWRVNGLPGYLSYLEKFHVPFELRSQVRFGNNNGSSGPIILLDGNWTFMLSSYVSPSSSYRGEEGYPLNLHVSYIISTESASSPPRLAFELWLAAHVEDEYVSLPSQISHPLLVNSRSSYGGFDWRYSFVWSDVRKTLVELLRSAESESQVVEFRFVINSYQDGNVTSADADCSDWRSGEDQLHHHHQRNNHSYGLPDPDQTNSSSQPPFLSQLHSLMKDDKYTDLTVKTGDEEFQIHRVVAAYSSPVLATMIYNLTYDKSESLLDLGEDIGSDAVEELIRYMYTGRVDGIEEVADRLIVAATNYGFPVLKRQCEQVLVKQVRTENAFSMYELGAEVGSQRLKRRAFNIMKENKAKIVAQSEEFRKLSVHHPDVMYELFLS